MHGEFRRQIKKWNKAVGLLPKQVDMAALLKQAGLVLEEAKETYDAAIGNDPIEVLDGLCDVFYTLEHLKTLMDMAGYDTHGAMQAVVENNELKIRLTESEASALKTYFAERGEPCYITRTSATTYAVQRCSDNKVMKQQYISGVMTSHPKVDLSKFLPEGE